jgi:type II secretory pathway pseudopilin PulG
MAGLMAAVAIMMIFSALAFQAWTDVLRRDNEAEMIFRGREIARAIQRYRADHQNQGPAKLEDLMEPAPNRGNYYLRRLYDDPLVPNGKWGLLYMGPQGAIIDPAGTPLGGPAGPAAGQTVAGARPGQGQTQPLGGIANPAGQPGVTGLPIAGVRSRATGEPFRIYKGQIEYSRWTFTYLDAEQEMGVAGPRGKTPGRRR